MAPSDEINFRKLIGGRVQLILGQKEVGYFLLHEKFKPEEIQLLTHTIHYSSAKDNFFILSKKIKRSPRMMKLFNRGLKKLKESGKYDQFWEEFQKEYNIKK